MFILLRKGRGFQRRPNKGKKAILGVLWSGYKNSFLGERIHPENLTLIVEKREEMENKSNGKSVKIGENERVNIQQIGKNQENL